MIRTEREGVGRAVRRAATRFVRRVAMMTAVLLAVTLRLAAPAGAVAPPASTPGSVPEPTTASGQDAASAPDSVSAQPPEPAPAGVLAAWELAGDPLIAPGDLGELLAKAPGDTLFVADLETARTTLEARLKSAGWWGASVVTRTHALPEGRIRVVLDVVAGQPTIIGEVTVRGNLEISREEILAHMELRPGHAFDAAVFRRDADRILRDYSERGYALARVYPSRFRRTEDDRLGFDVRIGEGPIAKIETVRVFGNDLTADRVIGRIGGVRVGDRWDVRRIEGMAPRLRREGLFPRVGEPRVVTGSRDAFLGVEIEVEEGPAGSLFGVLGYNPDPKGGGELVGLVDLRLHNILGTARRASLRFERRGADVQDVAFRFREPWILGTPISLEGGASQALRDTLYSRTDLDVTVAVPIGDRTTFRVAAERRDSSFDDALGSTVNETATGGSVGLATDWRDRRLNPRTGWALDLAVGARRTESGERRTRLQVDGQVLLPWGRHWVLSEEFGGRGVWSTATDVPLYEQFYMGGTNTLRGYREEQFHGERVWWTRSEMRYRFSMRSRAYVFGDVGGWEFDTAHADGPIRRLNDTLIGTGFGASLQTRGSGQVRLEFALGRGDGFSDAKVHAALEQEF